jgi:hypothetical protein
MKAGKKGRTKKNIWYWGWVVGRCRFWRLTDVDRDCAVQWWESWQGEKVKLQGAKGDAPGLCRLPDFGWSTLNIS